MSLIPFRYYFHIFLFVLVIIFVDFLEFFSALFYFIFPILFGKFNHIVKFEQVWKISYRCLLSQKICKIFFITIISSGIFLSSFKTSRLKIMRKILHGTLLFSCRKGCQVLLLPSGDSINFPHDFVPSVQTQISRGSSSKISEENSHRYSPPYFQKWHSEVLSLSLPSKWSGWDTSFCFFPSGDSASFPLHF